MKSIVYSFAAVPVLVSVFNASPSFAQEKTASEGLFSQRTPTVDKALELGVQFGYSQGVGDVGRDHASVHDTAGAGAALGVHVGYRLSPEFMIGAYANGGLMPWVGGELARAALQNEREAYGVALIRQYATHLRETGGAQVWYWPDGTPGHRTTNEVNYAAQKFVRAAIGSNNIDSCNRT